MGAKVIPGVSSCGSPRGYPPKNLYWQFMKCHNALWALMQRIYSEWSQPSCAVAVTRASTSTGTQRLLLVTGVHPGKGFEIEKGRCDGDGFFR